MPGPKPQLLLQEWIPRNNEEVDRLFRFMVDHGVNARTARSTIGRLMTLPRESPLTNSQLVERARLRKLLASLGEPPWDPDREPAVIELSPLSSVGGPSLNYPVGPSRASRRHHGPVNQQTRRAA